MEEVKKKRARVPREPKVYEALITFAALVAVMAVGIIVFEVDPHVPMFVGVIVAMLIAWKIGYKWVDIEKAMMGGIYKALQAVLILIIIGILVGVWIVGGVVPAMIYYGLKLLSPSLFLVAALLICSITSLATGTSWGTMGTMGIALMGIAIGLGIPEPAAAGAIISGAYFGDKMSPLSDTTNLAPAMAGTDLFTHIKFMLLPTSIAYGIAIVVFLFLGFHYVSDGSAASTSAVTEMSDGLYNNFNINPALLIPPLVVIVAVVFKVPAIPGIILGIVTGAIAGMIFQGDACTLGDVLGCGMSGYTSETGIASVDDLLTSGGIENMLYSVSLTIIAMMFGGIMEQTKQLEVIVNKLMWLVRGPVSLITMTEATCVVSNATMPEQYISLVVPGRMYAETYEKKGLHAKTLSNALESAGTVTSALIPWNTCGVFILGTLGVATYEYLPFAVFNYVMPVLVVVMAAFGFTVADKDGNRLTKKERRAAIKENFKRK